MKKILSLTVCLVLVCSLNGCTVFNRGSSNAYRNDKELADEMIENIIDCAEKEDAKALTELFSQYAKNSILNLDKEAEEFINYFQGSYKSWNGNANYKEKSEYGQIIWRELKGHYSVITDEAQYEIAYIYIPFDKEKPDKEGLTSIEITTEEIFNKDEFLWSLDKKPGIYVTKDKEETYLEQSLITPEELIQASGLTKEQYSEVDLEQFIEDFDIKCEDVNTLNIPLLLEEYEPERKFGIYG